MDEETQPEVRPEVKVEVKCEVPFLVADYESDASCEDESALPNTSTSFAGASVPFSESSNMICELSTAPCNNTVVKEELEDDVAVAQPEPHVDESSAIGSASAGPEKSVANEEVSMLVDVCLSQVKEEPLDDVVVDQPESSVAEASVDVQETVVNHEVLMVLDSVLREVKEEPEIIIEQQHPKFEQGQVTVDDEFLTIDDLEEEVVVPRSRLNNSESDSESDVFFEVVSRCRSNYDPDDPNYQRPTFERTFDDEYYFLPQLEALNLEDKPTEKDLRPFGVVHTVIDFVVTIKPLPQIPAMDYDSVLFTNSAEPIGEIFEIFGQITEPMYAVRFNTDSEAEKYPIGTEVFYAPNYLRYTKTFFPHDLAKIMYHDDNDDSEFEFSDDDEERNHNQKQRAKGRSKPNFGLPGQKKPRQVHFGHQM
ncbi:unnamed protein product [Bursaphelenchus okinawaensis]|uniref:H/ACA ribonucleoprotein complex non-core subunit NAF1 n=1 Tax=Bursaphelenchus okinawaensis TaxID=465554 RepID=A0A811L0W0_9BILA|nr:unnamed protein product [Bursaphelenchus okinawaensis]CAG9114122.1 unnamed protein product [Bursaphelenchus okinawaensis]